MSFRTYPEALARMRATPGNPYYGASEKEAQALYDKWERTNQWPMWSKETLADFRDCDVNDISDDEYRQVVRETIAWWSA